MKNKMKNDFCNSVMSRESFEKQRDERLKDLASNYKWFKLASDIGWFTILLVAYFVKDNIVAFVAALVSLICISNDAHISLSIKNLVAQNGNIEENYKHYKNLKRYTDIWQIVQILCIGVYLCTCIIK